MDRLEGLDHIVSQCVANGLTYYELPLPTVLMALAQEAKGDFLDVGANTGLYSLLAAAANPALQTVAFEPVPTVRTLMHRNLNANAELANRIDVSALALSNLPGRATIYEHVNPVGFVPTSSTLESEFNELDSEPIEIDVSTLDLWSKNPEGASGNSSAREGRRLDFRKIDVERHEKQMFEGSMDIFSRDRPLIIVELLAAADFAFFKAFMTRFGYIDLALFPGEARRLDTLQFEPNAWNHVLCPAERSWIFACTCRRIGLPIV